MSSTYLGPFGAVKISAMAPNVEWGELCLRSFFLPLLVFLGKDGTIGNTARERKRQKTRGACGPLIYRPSLSMRAIILHCPP